MPKSTSNSKRNTSGQGPVGRAPFSRAPIKAAVKPTGPRNPNGAGNQGAAKTGGGEGSRSHVKITPVVGSASTRKTGQGVAGDGGKAIGNHVMGSANGGQVKRNDPPLHNPAQAPSRMGNDLALNVGRGGPGAGRFNHGQSGSQGTYGGTENNQGQIAADRTIVAPGPKNSQGQPLATRLMGQPQGGGGPGGFGFKGK
jgi:hypothetical protein